MTPPAPSQPDQSGSSPASARRQRRIKKGWNDLTDKEKIAWQVKVVELKAQKGGKLDNGDWKQLLKSDFGYYNEDLGRSLRAAIARTSGNFRPMFEERIRTVFGDEAKQYLDRLPKA
jgi:hypothetical protein